MTEETNPTTETGCPNCNSNVESDAIICIHCGYNFSTGQSVVKEQGFGLLDDPVDVDEEPSLSPINWFVDLFPGLFRPIQLIAAIICLGGVAACTHFVIYFARIGGVFPMAVLGVAALVLYCQALSFILCPGFCFLNSATDNFETKHWNMFWLAILVPVVGWGYTVYNASQIEKEARQAAFRKPVGVSRIVEEAKPGDTVSAIGFLSTPREVTVSGVPGTEAIETQRLILIDTPGFPDRLSSILVLIIPVGDGINTMRPLRQKFGTKDIEVSCNDGTIMGFRDKLVVTGKLNLQNELVVTQIDVAED